MYLLISSRGLTNRGKNCFSNGYHQLSFPEMLELFIKTSKSLSKKKRNDEHIWYKKRNVFYYRESQQKLQAEIVKLCQQFSFPSKCGIESCWCSIWYLVPYTPSRYIHGIYYVYTFFGFMKSLMPLLLQGLQHFQPDGIPGSILPVFLR